MEEVISLQESIIGILNDCQDAFQKTSQPEEFQKQVDSALSQWMEDAIFIAQEYPDLSSLNDILSVLAALSAEEYAKVYKEQIWVVYEAVHNCELLESSLQGDFGEVMNSYINNVQSDDDTENESDDESVMSE